LIEKKSNLVPFSSRLRNQNEILIEKSDEAKAKQSQSRIFFEKKDEAFIHKKTPKNPKSHRECRDSLATKRFN
jgi:AAA15 family ATPase/GTPase